MPCNPHFELSSSLEQKLIATLSYAKCALAVEYGARLRIGGGMFTVPNYDVFCDEYLSVEGCIRYSTNYLTKLRVEEVNAFVTAVCKFYAQNGRPFNRERIPALLHWCMLISHDTTRIEKLGIALSATKTDWTKAFDHFLVRCMDDPEGAHEFSHILCHKQIGAFSDLYPNTGNGNFKQYDKLSAIVRAHEVAVRVHSSRVSPRYGSLYLTAEQLCEAFGIEYVTYLATTLSCRAA